MVGHLELCHFYFRRRFLKKIQVMQEIYESVMSFQPLGLTYIWDYHLGRDRFQKQNLIFFMIVESTSSSPISLSIKVVGSVLEATSLFAEICLPLAKQTPIALSFSIIILITLALVNMAPPLDSINLASAMGRLTKPPLTTLLPLSCAIVANR